MIHNGFCIPLTNKGAMQSVLNIMYFDHLRVVYDTLPINEQTALLAVFAVAEIGLLTVTGTIGAPTGQV